MAGHKFGFLRSRYVQVLTVVLVAQLIGLYAISRQEHVPLARPLAEFPAQVGNWRLFQETAIEKDVLDVLKADEVLTRSYMDTQNSRAASLFVAYFKSQRTGQAPHSPKNCLPGSGWAPSESRIVQIAIPGLSKPIDANRYVVERGDQKSVVLYWYQSRDRVVASEYWAKFYLVADSIRYNRSDTALVRVVVPVVGRDAEAAARTAEAFVQEFFSTLRQHLPA